MSGFKALHSGIDRSYHGSVIKSGISRIDETPDCINARDLNISFLDSDDTDSNDGEEHQSSHHKTHDESRLTVGVFRCGSGNQICRGRGLRSPVC